MNCFGCGATVDNGLALCEMCQMHARLNLEYLPIYYRNLARWRPGRAGSRPVPGSRVLYDGGTAIANGTGDRISDHLDNTTSALFDRAHQLVKDRPYLARLLARLTTAKANEKIDEAQAITWLCRGFDRHLTSVATLDWCGDLVHDIAHHETVLRNLTETLVPGWYAGACQRCDAPTYVVPGLSWVLCRGCGARTYARDHLETVLVEARGWVARPMALAGAVVALVDTEQSVPRLYERIKKWEQREKILGIQRAERVHAWSATEERIVVTEVLAGQKRYRLGDVLDMVLRERAGLDDTTITASAS